MTAQNDQSLADEQIHALIANLNGDPASYADTMGSKEKLEWTEAINEELNSMYKNNVWSLVNRPIAKDKDRKPNIIDSRWVLKRKIESNNQVRYKARLVIRDFKDKNVYDLNETYVPVSQLPLIRVVLAIINKCSLEVC